MMKERNPVYLYKKGRAIAIPSLDIGNSLFDIRYSLFFTIFMLRRLFRHEVSYKRAEVGGRRLEDRRRRAEVGRRQAADTSGGKHKKFQMPSTKRRANSKCQAPNSK
jgi:hypothetical protein